MSNGFNLGGGPIIVSRDKGTPNQVKNLLSSSTTQGPKLSSPLPASFILQAGAYSAQFGIKQILTKLWVKVSGTWKETTTWVKIAGTWKQSTVLFKNSGTWK